MKESNESELRVQLAEAFAWYTNSWKRDQIIDFCIQQIEFEKDQEVRNELIRTVSRLSK